MNNKVINALAKVCEYVDFPEKILGIDNADERLEKIFELCKKSSNEDFTKEDLELTLSECFILAFENLGNIQNIEESDLENVAGGMNFKKLTAASLAALSLFGVMSNKGFAMQSGSAAAQQTGIASGLWQAGKQKFQSLDPTDKFWVVYFGVLLVLAVGSGLYKLLKWLSTDFADDVVKPSYRLFKDMFIYNRHALADDPVEFRKSALNFLKQNVFAQDRAIASVVNIISGHIDMWKESKDTGKPCQSACVMTFIGDSGTGKTYTARLLSQLLFGKDMQPWQFITASSVKAPPPPSNAPKVTINFNSFTQQQANTDNSKIDSDLSPADRLFNDNSPTIHQLRKNNNVIIVFDELDKIHKNDPQDTILERLRDAKDTGKLRVHLSNGEYEDIDVSRTVFICISNELRECWGLPKTELTPAQAAARTYMDRDKSLVNRFDVVEYEYFKTEDYMVILDPLVKQLQKAYSEAYNMSLEFSKDFASNVAQVAFEKNKGVRGLNDFLVKLRGVLVGVRSKKGISPSNKSSSENKISWKVKIDYDKSRDDFSATAEKIQAK